MHLRDFIAGLIPVSKLKDIDVFKPESLWDTARLAWGLSAIGGLLVDQVCSESGFKESLVTIRLYPSTYLI